MSHCDHCHSNFHRRLFRVRRVGALGAILMVLHLLFHLVEFLVLPAALVAFGGHATEEPAVATSEDYDLSNVHPISFPGQHLPAQILPEGLTLQATNHPVLQLTEL